MPDRPPPLEPRSGDYAAMLDRAARRRRARRVRGLAAAAPVLVLAVALAALPDGGAATLRPTSSATADPTADPTPEPTAQPGEPTAAPSGDPTAEPSGEPAPPSGPAAEPTPPGEPGDPEPSETAGPPSPTPYPTKSRSGGPSPAPRDSASYVYLRAYAPDDCRTLDGSTGAPDTANWCAGYLGEGEFARYHGATLPFRLCRSRTAGAGTLTRYGDSWFKVRALDEHDEVPWSFSAASKPAVPAIVVEPGDCAQWTVTWNAPLDPGAYRLNAVFVAEEYQPGGGGLWTEITVTG